VPAGVGMREVAPKRPFIAAVNDQAVIQQPQHRQAVCRHGASQPRDGLIGAGHPGGLQWGKAVPQAASASSTS